MTCIVVEVKAARGSSSGRQTGVPPRYKASKSRYKVLILNGAIACMCVIMDTLLNTFSIQDAYKY